MKSTIKTAIHLISILSLAVFVFAGGIMVKFGDKGNTKEEGGLKKAPSLSLGVGTNHASADVPVPVSGDSCDTDGDGGGDC